MPSNFKVLAGASGEPIDPNFRNVTLLLHGDGNNGGQNNAFVDSSSNHFPISRNGNTTQGSFSPYGSNWSNYFDGNGDYLTGSSSIIASSSTSTFTIEGWVFPTTFANRIDVIGDMAGAGTNDTKVIAAEVNTSGQVALYWFDGAIKRCTGNTAMVLNQWNYFAIVVSSNAISIYVNKTTADTLSGTTTLTNRTQNFNFAIGAYYNAPTFNGYFSNLRVSTIARTISSVPTAPLTADANTRVLTCADNRFRDGSTNNFTITRNGDVKVTNFAPFAPSSPAAYDQSDVQYWSGSFNGGTDRVQVPVTSNMYLGTTYTIEAWAYYSGTSYGARPIFSQCESFQGGFAGLTLTLNTSGNLVAEYRPATSGTVTTITGPTVTPNTWFHIALVSDNSSAKLFVNGQQVGSTTTFGDYPSAKTTFVAVGSWGHGWNDGGIPAAAWIGYISNMRVVKGVAVYSTNFTPPTSPLTAVSGTVLLTCQNASFTDNSSVKNILTPVSNATVIGNSPYNPVGYWSNSFDGSGDYLSIPNNAALNMAGSTFTLECWIYPNGDYSDYRTIMSKRNASTTSYQMFLFQTTGYLSFSRANTAYQSSATPTANTWNHVAAVYDGTNINLYLNGTRVLQTAVSIADTTDPLLIGAIYTGGENFNGHISNARVLKSVQAYSGTTYTVPTTPLTAISGTSLLTCQANRFIDSSANAFTITPNGNVAVSDFDPFTGASVTSTGGSAYFDGNGDYCRIAGSQTALQFGTSNFTLEGWAYSTGATGTYQQILTGGSSWTSGSGGVYWYYNGGSPYIGAAWNQIATNPAVNSGTLATNTWHHFAIVRSGNTLTLYINGSSVDTLDVTGVSMAVNNQSQTNIGGGGWDQDFGGYLSNLRVVKGQAIYTSNFTPPSSPLTSTTNTQLLMNFTNAAIFDNSMKNDLETVGNAQISTSVKKFGTGSMYFDGTNSIITTTKKVPCIEGTENFTIEYWLYPSTIKLQTLVSMITTVSSVNPHTYMDGSGYVHYYTAGAQRISGNIQLSSNQWYHIAVCRSSGITRLFVNGTQSGSNYSDGNNYASPAYVNIGQYMSSDGTFYSGEWLSGYIDDLRITKGIARYTANFTPPAAPFPNK